MPSKKPKPADLTKVSQYAHAERANKSELAFFGKPLSGEGADIFFDSLPQFLKANDLKSLIEAIVSARQDDKPFHLMLGAHVIKVGLAPLIIDLMKNGIVTGLSFNSAGVIHDLELAFFGGTSEDVQAGLMDGSFGMVLETGNLFADSAKLADESGVGFGEGVGRLILERKAPNAGYSLFATAVDLGLPVTVHVGIGTDIVAQQPSFDGGVVGKTSHYDFRVLASICEQIDRGGVVANIGSAVILPEVFLKALTVARNLNQGESRLTTANFDMIMHYRPGENVVSRPTRNVGRGYNFVGHHEIMVPLLAWGLKLKMKSK